jgi:signal transduction histidine kinase
LRVEKSRRGLWLVDGFAVAAYLVLIAMMMPHLRWVSWVSYAPRDFYGPFGQVVVQAGQAQVFSGSRANGWERSVPALCTVILLPLMRRRPLVFAGTVAIGSVLIATVNSPGDARYLMFITADIALAVIAYTWPRRTSLEAAGLILAGGVVSMSAFPPGATQLTQTHVVLITLMATVAWLIGSSTRERRASVARHRADAATQAVANERLRIARELHDMIAHSIGIIAIQAGMGNRVIGTQPAEAQKALRAIEETSRDTLSQLRRTLTALRQGENAATPTDVAPGLADLDKLVASTKHAGVLAIVETRGMPRPLPGEIDLAAYRIIQESVTNVVRHSGARTCRVTVEFRESELAVTVADDGHGVLGSGGTGFGLVGMRERVTLVHGTFSAGPRPGGGFLVSATLPVPGGFNTVYRTAEDEPASDPEPAPADHNSAAAQGADADTVEPAAETGGPSQCPEADRPEPRVPNAPDQNPAVTP